MHRSAASTLLSASIALLAASPLSLSSCAQSAAGSAAPATHELRVFDPSLVDRSIDPCQNFYRFACNNWFKRNPLPADQASYGRYTELYELNRIHLRQILEQAAIASPNRTPNEQKIGDEYASCMDLASINKRGLAPLEPELARINALQSTAGLPALLAHFHAIGVDAFFAMGSNPDFANSSSVIAFYVAGGLGLPERDYYTRMDPKSVQQRQLYVQHVRNIFVLAGEPDAKAKQDAQTVLALETRLAKASLTITQQRDPQNLNHPTTVALFAKTLPNFSLPEYIAAAHAPASGKLDVTEPRFFAAFNQIVADTPLDQIKTYMRWHLLHTFADTSMPEAFDHETWHFYEHILNGAEAQQARWKRCTSRVDQEMGEALGQVYVAKYFPPEAKQHALEMTLSIEQAMGRDIDAIDWMSPETKAMAKEKLHAVMNKIGYPNKWRDYSRLTIVRGDPLGNQERVREFDFARDLAKIGKPVDKDEWFMSPPTVNAYYSPQMNNVNFPAGYFQPPFFSDTEDDAANYGDMGSTIGHELTHGFDDEGRQYDKDGNLRDWWTKADEQRFNQRAECLVKQYDAIEPVPGVHLNGKLTLGENIADLGGTWLAWMAWQERVHAEHVDMQAKMEGYTPDQRFWIAYAQQWCTQTRPEQLRTQAQTDPHAPDEYRANTVLSDLPNFAKSFQCKKDSPMVAKPVCRIW
jgi:putative endopeptidase